MIIKNDMFNVNIKSNIEDVADNSPQMNIDKKGYNSTS